jgi:division protein CdvB (Snf7/Vps24/ESCRT-III family)
MKQLTRADLLTKEKLEVVKVDLGNDECVYVTQMTGRQRDNFEQSLLKKVRDNKGVVTSYEQVTDDFRAKLAVVTVCDENGTLLFEPKDYNLLSMSIGIVKLEKIVNAAQKLNAISEEDKESLVKNSGPEAADSSSSVSVEN